jgi:hypothetical protein
MNYEQAREIGPDGPAPGKWNWTNFNDSVAPNPYTVAPCAWPDFTWPEPPLDKPISQWPKVTPTGRERCDHDTREEAERHHWKYELGRVRLVKLDLDAIRERHRCAVEDCLCEEHATFNTVVELHPFVPGVRSIHS